MPITKEDAQKAAIIVTSEAKGYEKHKRQVDRVINKLSQEYNESIPINHLKAALRKLQNKH